MKSRRDLVFRHAEPLVAEALSDTRVVAINGARQVGKSTIARALAAATERPVVRLLDDPVTFEAAREDPVGFVEHDGLQLIDEIQLAPQLLEPSSSPWTSTLGRDDFCSPAQPASSR